MNEGTPTSDTSGDAQRNVSSRPPRPHGPAGAGPDRPTPAVGTGNHHSDLGSPPSWLGDDGWEEPEAPRPRRHLVLALGVLPWLAVIAWFVRGGPADEPPRADPVPADPSELSPDADEPTPTAVPAPTPMASPSPSGEQVQASTPAPLPAGGGARDATTLADAAGLATVLARDWLGGMGPRLGVFDTALFEDAYVDQITVEAVDHPGTGHVVVTVLALVLESDGDDFTQASLQRVAVPVAADGAGVRPAGTPWLLAPPAVELDVPQSSAIDDPTLVPEVTRALEQAGYGHVEVLEVAGTDGWPFVVAVEAVAPGAEGSEHHVLWLRPRGNEFVVAGDRPQRIHEEEQR